MANNSNLDVESSAVQKHLSPDMPERRRRPIRLRGYDYTRHGAYFVTICTRNRACLLGDVIEGTTHLSEAGQLAQAVWEDLPRHYPHVQLDAWTIMPNHVHGIIVLTDGDTEPDGAPSVGAGLKPAPTTNADAPRHHPHVHNAGASPHRPHVHDDVGAGFKPAPTTNASALRHGLPEVVRAFKTFSSRRINASQGTTGTPFWQRNYYEHIIRNEEDLNRIRQYIEDNPARWHEDPENPAVRGTGLDDLPRGTSTPNPVGAGFKPAPTQGDKTRERRP